MSMFFHFILTHLQHFRHLITSPITTTRKPTLTLRLHRPHAGAGEIRRLLLRGSLRALRHPCRRAGRLCAPGRADQLAGPDGGAAGDGGGDARLRDVVADAQLFPLGVSGAQAGLAKLCLFIGRNLIVCD